MSFLPEGYKIPSENKYMRFQDGENTFRILDSAVIGQEYWVEKPGKDGRRPVRIKIDQSFTADDLQVNPKTGELDMPKHFWMFPVYNYNEKAVQLLELTQKSIMKFIKSLTKSKKWGDVKDYDITITKEGEGLETRYSVMPNPKEKLEKGVMQLYKDMEIRVEAIFDNDGFGTDPFSKEGVVVDNNEVAKALS